ncbi:hypothetical protein HY642_02030 [Candidatus Woesearchaeota archaeon]|nr:hypothetical protein [Candidatus Woesearchaeota archaeon]
MKRAMLIGMMLVLLIAGCAAKAPVPAYQPTPQPLTPVVQLPVPLTEQQILQQYDDGLDAAQQELDLIY